MSSFNNNSSYSSASTVTTIEEDDKIPSPPRSRFKEAEEMIKRKLEIIVNAATKCGGQRQYDQTSPTTILKKENIRHYGEKLSSGTNTWSQPSTSLSDWKLIVCDGTSKKIYNIHKQIVLYGPRRSLFLVQQFQKFQQSNNWTNGVKTEIALPNSVVDYVPQLFHYIYDSQLDLSTRNAVAMKYLGKYFQIKELTSLTTKYINQQLVSGNITFVIQYLNEAESLKDRELVQQTMNILITKIESLTEDQMLGIPIHLLPQLMSNPQVLSKVTSEWRSARIAFYIQNSNSKISDETFFFLTHAKVLPKIEPNKAIWYIEYTMDTFGKNMLLDDSMGDTMKQRCIHAVVSRWHGLLLSSEQNDCHEDRLFVAKKPNHFQPLKVLPPDMQIEILQEALVYASAQQQSQP